MISKSFLFITCVLVLFSCSATQKSAQSSPPTQQNPSPDITTQVTPPKPAIKTSISDTIPPPAFKIDTLISFSAGACVGHCPVYSYTILNDGSVSWHGQNYITRIGNFITKLPHDKIEVLSQWISEYAPQMSEEYPRSNDFIPDFPLTKIYLKNKQTPKSIVVNHSAPTELKNMLSKVESWLEQTEWKTISN